MGFCEVEIPVSRRLLWGVKGPNPARGVRNPPGHVSCNASDVNLAPTALDCVLAARSSELTDLRSLEQMVDLVDAVTDFVHRAQGERGLSSLMLARRSEPALDRLRHQRAQTDTARAALLARVQTIDLAAAGSGGHGARLYSRLGVALQALQALPALRARVDAGGFDVQQSTRAYSRLVGAWMSLVFEVADVAGDAEITRLLVALFNLTHAKELAGQERALGSALFASGQVDDESRQQVQDLIDSQVRGLSAFSHFASAALQVQMGEWQRRQHGDGRAKLRRVLLEPSAHGALNPALGTAWFDNCTAHLDELRALEVQVLKELQAVCAQRGGQLQQEVSELARLCQAPQPVTPEAALLALAQDAADGPQPPGSPPAGLAPDGALGPVLARQVMDMVQEQAHRLQTVTAELEEARGSLQDRKLIERAKGLLMAQASLTEDEAYQALRRRAMQQGRRLAEVAQDLLRRTN